MNFQTLRRTIQHPTHPPRPLTHPSLIRCARSRSPANTDAVRVALVRLVYTGALGSSFNGGKGLRDGQASHGLQG
eukprot:13605524-Alexandrium_andersonii.AAC.1